MKISKYIITSIIAISVISFITNNEIESFVGGFKEKENKIIIQKKGNIKNPIVKEESDVKETVLLVNNTNKLDESYMPNLKEVDIPFIANTVKEEKQMDEVAIPHIIELFRVAKDENIILLATSGYRSYDFQEKLYNDRVKSQGRIKADQYVAKPGSSEHQSGLAMDITNKGRYFVESSEEAMWLANNSHRFGFILRYPKGKEHITGKSYEPWHVRYVGKDIAKEIYEKRITLEEYMKIK